MVLTKENIRGIMPPMVTPFTEDEDLDEAAFRREAAYLLSLRTGALIVGGSTGEGASLAPEELARGCEIAVEEARGRVPIIAGVITDSARDAVRRGKLAKEAGVAGLMVTPIIYRVPTDNGLYEYYRRVHEEVGLPIIIYNVVPRAPVSPTLLARLAGLDGIIGVKESAAGDLDTLSDILSTVRSQIAVTWAQDPLLFPGFALGAVGSISAINTVVPQLCIDLWEATERGDLAKAQECHFHILPVARQLRRPNMTQRIKTAINLQGRPVGQARSPMIPLAADEERQMAAALEEAGVLQPLRN